MFRLACCERSVAIGDCDGRPSPDVVARRFLILSFDLPIVAASIKWKHAGRGYRSLVEGCAGRLHYSFVTVRVQPFVRVSLQ